MPDKLGLKPHSISQILATGLSQNLIDSVNGVMAITIKKVVYFKFEEMLRGRGGLALTSTLKS